MNWYCTVHKRECPSKKGCPPEVGGILMPCQAIPIVEGFYRQSARPFIQFPLDNSTEGWIQVAANLEIMINDLIAKKAEHVVVQYVDRRLGGEISQPSDYGLAIEAFKDFQPEQSKQDFFEGLLKRPLPDGQ